MSSSPKHSNSSLARRDHGHGQKDRCEADDESSLSYPHHDHSEPLSVTEDLQRVVVEYLSCSSVRSVAFLARKSALPYSTVRRAAQGDGVPTLITVLSLLAVIQDSEGALSFIRQHFPESYDLLKVTFDGGHRAAADIKLAQYVSESLSNQILHLTSCGDGTTEDDIKRLFGSVGIRKVQAMIDDGYVIRQSGKLKFYRDQLIILPTMATLKHIEILTEIFDTQLLGTPAALMAGLSESVSAPGLAKIKAAGEEYVKKVARLYETDRGDIPHYMAVYQTTPYHRPNKDGSSSSLTADEPKPPSRRSKKSSHKITPSRVFVS